MDYIINVQIENNQNIDVKSYERRMISYYNLLRPVKLHEEKENILLSFFEKESKIERRVYGRMTNWKNQHPIMGIVICTILGAILLNLVASCIFEAYIGTL